MDNPKHLLKQIKQDILMCKRKVNADELLINYKTTTAIKGIDLIGFLDDIVYILDKSK